MKLWSTIRHCWWLLLLVFVISCTQQEQSPEVKDVINPEMTIGSVSQIHFFDAIPVRGIGIVAGLHGTGSSECPPRVRQELEKYIWKQLPADGGINPRAFIESTNTAVVEVFGVIPPLASNKDLFDIAVRPLSSSQTTSLDGGHLYATELKELSRLARLEQFSMFSKTMATVEGSIFSNHTPVHGEDNDIWYVLGGAKPIQNAKIMLILNQPDFLTANAIRNRINERFGTKTAIPTSESEIVLHIPARYQEQKERFLQMANSLQLGDSPAVKERRITELTQQLIAKPDNEDSKIALEAIGKPALDALAQFLDHPDESVRFHTASCMLSIGDNRALATLRNILLNPVSRFRMNAIEVIGRNATRTDVRAILTVALSDADIQVRLSAYELLLRMNSSVISRKIVAGDFVVDSVMSADPKMVYVYQQKTPRIVLFGSPIYCKKDLFIQSDDGSITINAKPGDKFISVSRKHPQRHRVIGPLNAGFDISNLVQTLGELPEVKNRSRKLPGLAVSYAEILPILEKMCNNNAIPAQFIAGPETEIDPLLQDLPPISR